MFLTCKLTSIKNLREPWKGTYAITRYAVTSHCLEFTTASVGGRPEMNCANGLYPGDRYRVRDYDGNILLNFQA